MAMPTTSPPGRSALGVAGLAVGITGLLAAAIMGVVLVRQSNERTAQETALGVTAGGFMIEAADSIGPDAFTAPVNTAPGGNCDPESLIRKLGDRPEARRAWAQVLGILEADVDAYIHTLKPRILATDTQVTNHGLHDGQAYARQSLLKSGTAVLVDTAWPYAFPPGGNPTAGPPNQTTRMTSTTSTSSTSTSTTTTTAPGSTTTGSTTPGTPPSSGEQPVTRCRCGNPLLPPYENGPPSRPPGTVTTTTSPGTTLPGTTERTVRRSTTEPTTPTSGPTTTSTQPSSTIPPSTSVPPSTTNTTSGSTTTSRTIIKGPD